MANRRSLKNLEAAVLAWLDDLDSKRPEVWAVEWQYTDRPKAWWACGSREEAEKEARNYRDADADMGRTTGRIRPTYCIHGDPVDVKEEAK